MCWEGTVVKMENGDHVVFSKKQHPFGQVNNQKSVWQIDWDECCLQTGSALMSFIFSHHVNGSTVSVKLLLLACVVRNTMMPIPRHVGLINTGTETSVCVCVCV